MKLIAALSDAIKEAALEGDAGALRIAQDALTRLVGQPGGNVSPVVDLASRRRP